MGIMQRIEEVRAVEHARLKTALGRVNSVLHELEQARSEAKDSRPPTLDMFGQPVRTPDAQPLADLQPLYTAWQSFEATTLGRLELWERRLLPLVTRWDTGEDVSREIRALTDEIATSGELADRYLKSVRVHSSFVGEARATMLVVYRAVDTARRAEENLVPALLEGSREAADRTAEGAIPRFQSASSVTQSLRARRLPDTGDLPGDPRSGSGGLLRTLFDWLRRR